MTHLNATDDYIVRKSNGAFVLNVLLENGKADRLGQYKSKQAAMRTGQMLAGARGSCKYKVN